MQPLTLVLLEVAGIQDYIFSSNHLPQNIGASELVHRATTEWVADALPGIPHNGHWNGVDLLIDPPHLDQLSVQIIYAGGGKALLVFVNPDPARAFISRLSLRVVKEARDLDLVALCCPVQEAESLAQAHFRALTELSARKLNRPHSQPMSGLGVTAACAYTGLPATHPYRDPSGIEQYISTTAEQKIQWAEQGKERLHQVLAEQVREHHYQFVYDFDQFGERDQASYLAVIHIDGNRMSERFERIAKTFPAIEMNQDYIQALAALSQSIKDTARAALQATVAALVNSLQTPEFAKKIPIRQKRLPFRPIVFGGDDVTLVCDGRIGLALAERYLSEWGRLMLADQRPAVGRAGVAVIKNHYPFSRAYALADDLAQQAKAAIDLLKADEEETIAVLDWHFASAGLALPLNELRQREYCMRDGTSLLMRPIRLTTLQQPAATWRTWQNFVSLETAFLQKDGPWAGKRNKLKALRDALRQGPNAVRLFRTRYRREPLPPIPQHAPMADTGWDGNECGYFDAIEAMDYFVPLMDGPAKEAA